MGRPPKDFRAKPTQEERARAAARRDSLRSLLNTHAELPEIMAQLEHDMAGMAESEHEGMQRRLKAGQQLLDILDIAMGRPEEMPTLDELLATGAKVMLRWTRAERDIDAVAQTLKEVGAGHGFDGLTEAQQQLVLGADPLSVRFRPVLEVAARRWMGAPAVQDLLDLKQYKNAAYELVDA